MSGDHSEYITCVYRAVYVRPQELGKGWGDLFTVLYCLIYRVHITQTVATD